LRALLVAGFVIGTWHRTALGLEAQGTSATPPDGEAAFEAGNFELAEVGLAAALDAHPDDVATLIGMARIRLYQDRRAEARQLASRGLAAAHDDAALLRVIAAADERDAAFAAGHFVVRPSARPLTVPFVTTDPLPLLKVRLDGQREVTLLLDTGAPTLVLDPAVVTELGLETRDAGRGTFAGGRQAALRRTVLPSLDAGELHVTNIDTTVLATRGLKLGDRAIDGILGTGFLMHFLATIDYRDGALVLRPRSASAAELTRAQRAGASIVPMWLVGDHFVFVRGHLNRAPDVLLHVDTGLAGGGVEATRAALDAAGVALDDVAAATGQGGGGEVTFLPFQADVTIGAIAAKDVHGIYTPDGNQYSIFPFAVGGTVSHEFFRRTRLTLDFAAMKIVIEQ
jgi:predicted aspartyl protease